MVNVGSIAQVIINAKEREVGIDLDRCNDMSILTTYFNAKSLSDSIRIYKSSSERGYHFILKFDDPLTVEQRLAIREYLGDCVGRLYFSRMRGGDDILFDLKTQGSEWRRRKEISEATLINPYNGRKFK